MLGQNKGLVPQKSSPAAQCTILPFPQARKLAYVMESLPRDLLPSVLCYTTAEEAMKIKLAIGDDPGAAAVSQECSNRLCVKRYLGESFEDPVSLLRAMSKSGAVLSGVRSLEFFVPGSGGEEAVWDFYVPSIVASASHFATEMKRMGVAWERSDTVIKRLLKEGEGSTTLAPDQWSALADTKLYKTIEEAGYEYVKKGPIGCGTVLVTVSKKKFLVQHIVGGMRSGDVKFIMNGHMTYRGKTSTVRVMAMDTHIVQHCFLHRFSSSCIQSYISAHAACHLYGKISSDRLGHSWVSPPETQGTAQATLECSVRGYKFVSPRRQERGFSVRVSDDQFSTFIGGYNHVGAPEDFVSASVLCSRSAIWIEEQSFTRPVACGAHDRLCDAVMYHPWSCCEETSSHPYIRDAAARRRAGWEEHTRSD